MCGCSSKNTSASSRTTIPGAIVFRVEDMTCGHCAGRITKTVLAGIPGTAVVADPGSRTVQVTGTADREAVRALIAGAGYTPADPAYA